MEFACGFVYVAPATRCTLIPNQVKRSALLPPPNRVRPRIPPPPVPTPTKEPPVPVPPDHPAPKHLSPHSPKHTPVNENLKHLTESSSQHTPAAFPFPGLSSPPPVPQRIIRLSEAPVLTYDLPRAEPEQEAPPIHPDYCFIFPEGSGQGRSPLITPGNSRTPHQPAAGPPLPPRPSFMKKFPEYLLILPFSSSSSSPSPPPSTFVEPLQTPRPSMTIVAEDSMAKQPLAGNPNVILVSLEKVLTDENVHFFRGEPSTCSQCGSVHESCYDNVVDACYFCQSWEPASQPRFPPIGCQDSLYLLNPDPKALLTPEIMFIFCIDISGSMSMRYQVKVVEEQSNYRTRLQEAVLRCVHTLSERDPNIRVGLITFNNQVMLHGYGDVASQSLQGRELTDSEYLKEVGLRFPSPPPLSQTRDHLQKEIYGLQESGATALGPAAVVAIAMASKLAGSKVLVCTDGRANTDLGNLEVEDRDTRSLVSSSIFYQGLGEYAASQGVTVSVLSLKGTDCRLDELGRLADRTGGKVVIASPDKLYSEFKGNIENRTMATHCSVTLLLPTTLCVVGEREASHRGIREVGNVAADSEITFQYGVTEQSRAFLSGRSVSVQLQVRYRRRDGLSMLRVITMDREVTDDSSLVLSSLSLSILQLNSCQSSATLAVRGRFRDAQREKDQQKELIERALEHRKSAEDGLKYMEWVKTMDPVYNNLYTYTRKNYSSSTDFQSLTDVGAALLYEMKNSSRKSISLKPCS